MALTIDEVRKISTLARLRLTAEEERRFVPQLARIVDYIDQLRQYEALEPAFEAVRGFEAPDRPGACLPVDDFVRNAPETHGDLLSVPQVMGGEDA